MSILAVHRPPPGLRSVPPPSPAQTSTSPQEPADRARKLREAIEHHRAESRRLAFEAKNHRKTVARLLQERQQHAAELRTAGWALAAIGELYRLTRERVRQLVTGDGTGVA